MNIFFFRLMESLHPPRDTAVVETTYSEHQHPREKKNTLKTAGKVQTGCRTGR